MTHNVVYCIPFLIMTYMTVDERSNDKLVLKRSPGLYAVAVAIGIFAVLMYLTRKPLDIESDWWTPIARIICFLASLSTIDNWEVSEFNKKTEKVTFTKQSLWQRILNQQPSSVVVSLQSVENVTIEETVLKYVKQKVRVVVLTSNEGHKYYVTGSGTTDPISDHKAMCQEIRSFLNLQDEKEDCSN